ncbi:MAG: CHASE4 domain-containing protein [Fibrobacterota bacterium]
MTLRKRTLLTISLTLAALIIVLFLVTRTIIQSGFKKIENELVQGFSDVENADARRNVQRVTDALKLRIENISVKVSDWAQWDDSWVYMQDRNKKFLDANVNTDALASLKLNMILFYTEKGVPAGGMAYDLEKEEEVPVPESVTRFLSPDCYLLKHESVESDKNGLILLKEGALLIASRPIRKSDDTGPIRGSILFARWFDAGEIEGLAHVTHLALTFYRMDATDIPEDFQKARACFTDKDPICVTPLADSVIAGYTTIADMQNAAALLVRVDIPRDIHRQGLSTLAAILKSGNVTLLSLVISIVVTGLILGFVILMLLERLVLSRLARLSGTAVEIGGSGDFSGRIEDTGTDEIGKLGGSLNHMLEALESSHLQMKARTAEMRLLMNTVPAGLLSMNEHYVVNPEFSLSAGRILGRTDLAGKPFAALLGLSGDRADDAVKLQEYLDVLRQELTSEDTIAELNPFDQLSYTRDSETRWLRTRYYLIRRDNGLPHHIMAVLEDITEEKQLEAQVVKSQRENLQLKAIAEDPDLFREFLAETRQILARLDGIAQTVSPAEDCQERLNEVYRGAHTIKGVAGSFGLFTVAEQAGRFEDSLEKLVAARVPVTVQDTETLRASLHELTLSFEAVVDSCKKILGDDITTTAGIFLRISLEELKRHITDIQAMPVDETLKDKMVLRLKEEILRRFRLLRTVPAKKGLARSIKIVAGLKERLGKCANFRFEGQDTLIDCETAHELNTPLVHLLRNAFDHGIESPETRLEREKSMEGEVFLNVRQEDDHLSLMLSDDGRGLEPELIKAVALKKGIISEMEAKRLSPQQSLALIFRPGFTTLETVTEVSGRGVGMDAVLTSVRNKLHGEIHVDSLPGKGTQFTIRIPA